MKIDNQMGYNLDRDFIWQAEYGNRTYLKKILKDLLVKQKADSLQCLALYVNNNPYNLEFFILVSYDKPAKEDIEYMKMVFENAGLIYRQDLTMQELMLQMGNRRFNSMTLLDDSTVDIALDTLFFYPDKKTLSDKGYLFVPFGKNNEVFISHSSKDKKEIEEVLPYINAINLPVWFDKYNIDVGESIVEKVQEGLQNSKAVIFWITKNFINSKWCKKEMQVFIRRMIEENILIISILDKGIEIKDLPIFLQDIKFIRNSGDFSTLINEILVPLKKRFNL